MNEAKVTLVLRICTAYLAVGRKDAVAHSLLVPLLSWTPCSFSHRPHQQQDDPRRWSRSSQSHCMRCLSACGATPLFAPPVIKPLSPLQPLPAPSSLQLCCRDNIDPLLQRLLAATLTQDAIQRITLIRRKDASCCHCCSGCCYGRRDGQSACAKMFRFSPAVG